MSSMESLKKLIACYEEIHNIHELKYAVERLEEYREALFTYAKFKVGDTVAICKVPEINEKVRWGWIGYKKFFVKGSIGKIMDVDWYKGRFRYGVNFKGDKEGHQFTVDEEFLETAKSETICPCCNQPKGE